MHREKVMNFLDGAMIRFMWAVLGGAATIKILDHVLNQPVIHLHQ
jgi:hypothetical protein